MKNAGSHKKAKELASEIPDSYIPMQFENKANPEAHRKSTALEIIEAMKQIGKPLKAFVAAAGTGGTITGTGEVLRDHYPDLTVHVVEPAGSRCFQAENPANISSSEQALDLYLTFSIKMCMIKFI